MRRTILTFSAQFLSGKPDSVMPFSLSDLVEMSRVLLDVLIGLIEIMFSETRSTVVNAYGKAMLSVGARPLGETQSLDSWNSTCQVGRLEDICLCTFVLIFHSKLEAFEIVVYVLCKYCLDFVRSLGRVVF